MKKIILLLTLLVLLFSCGSTGEKKEDDSPEQTTASSDSERIVENDSFFIGREEAAENIRFHAYVDELLLGNIYNINYMRMRLAYAASTYYNPYEVHKSILHMKKLYEAKQYEDVVEIVKQNIKVLAPEIDFHLYAMLTYKALGDKDLQAYHSALMSGLIRSIVDSGDGVSRETAFEVISVNEEHVVLSYLEYSIVSSELLEESEHSYDKFAVQKDGEQKVLYFNVDIPLKWLNAQPR